MKCFTVTIVAILLGLMNRHAFAQDNAGLPIMVSVYSNATALPFQLPVPVHPGMRVATELSLNEPHSLAQSISLTSFYHNYSQFAVGVYSETEYCIGIGKMFELSAGGGFGGIISKTLAQSYAFVPEKGYVQKPQIRYHFLFSSNIQANCILKPSVLEAFLRYQFWFQMPYVKGYVPVLPNVALHLGVTLFPFNTKSKKHL